MQEIPGVLTKPDKKIPIARNGIDRKTLMDYGLPDEVIDRIYRALFVYSCGFYQLLEKSLEHTNNKY